MSDPYTNEAVDAWKQTEISVFWEKYSKECDLCFKFLHKFFTYLNELAEGPQQNDISIMWLRSEWCKVSTQKDCSRMKLYGRWWKGPQQLCRWSTGHMSVLLTFYSVPSAGFSQYDMSWQFSWIVNLWSLFCHSEVKHVSNTSSSGIATTFSCDPAMLSD